MLNNQDIEDLELEDHKELIELFLQSVECNTPLHVLINENKITSSLKIYDFYRDKIEWLEKQFDNYINDNGKICNEVNIIVLHFFNHSKT